MPTDGRKKKVYEDGLELPPLLKLTVDEPVIPLNSNNQVTTADNQKTITATPVTENKIKQVAPPTISVSIQRPGSISISATDRNTAVNVQGKPQATASTHIQTNNAFTIEQLEKAWFQFGESIPEQGRMMSLIHNSKPVLISESEFEVTVSNILQEKELKRLQSNILEFIHTRLQNKSICMSLKIKEDSEFSRNISPEEKYKAMAEQNPALTTLRNSLLMELD